MNFKEYTQHMMTVPISELEFARVPIGLHVSRMPLGVTGVKKKGTSVVKLPKKVRNTYGNMVSVITVKDTVFSGNESITNLILPPTICSLPSGAFADCCNLKNITIPRGISRIKEKTFDGCRSLENIYYEGSMEEWNLLNITHHRREITFGKQKAGAPIDEVETESLIHIAGNDAVLTANIYFNCDLQMLYMENGSEIIS